LSITPGASPSSSLLRPSSPFWFVPMTNGTYVLCSIAKAKDWPISILEIFKEETCSGYLMHKAEGFESPFCGETSAPQTYKFLFSSIQAEKFQHLISEIDLDLRFGISVKVR
jgi:hypothetical protein